MSDTSVDGVKVVVSVDTSQANSGVNNLKTNISSIGPGAQAAMAQATTAMAGATQATQNLGNATSSLGEKMSETGSKRELRESIRLLQAGAEGTSGAFDALKAILVTFASSLGGPALIAITAAVAVLGTLYELTKQYIEEQRLLTDESAEMKLPTDQIKAMSAALKTLSSQIVGATEGVGHLSQSQTNILTSLGLDPRSADSARQAFAMIQQSGDDLATKIHNYNVLIGETDPAKFAENWEKAMSSNKESAEGWFTTMSKYLAVGELNQGGNYDMAGKLMPKTRGQAQNEGVQTGAKIGTLRSQQEIDDEQKKEDALNSLAQKGSEARISTMKDEVEKILAEAELETERLKEEKKKQVASMNNDPTGQKEVGEQYDKTIEQVQAAARTRAAQVAQSQQLEMESTFQSQLAALRKAGADSSIGVEQTAGQKIIAEGQSKIDELEQQYLDDVKNLQKALNDKKISQQDYNREVAAYGTAFGSSVSSISTNSAAKAQQADNIEQEKQADQLKEYLTQSADDTAKATKGIVEDETQKIIDEGNAQLQAIQERYQKEVDLQKQMYAEKKLNDDTYNANMTQINNALDAAKTANAKAVADKIQAANNAPLTSLVSVWGNTSKQMSQFAADTASSISSSLVQMMMTGKLNLASLTQAILSDLAKIVLEKEIAGIVGGIMGGSFDANGVGSISSLSDQDINNIPMNLPTGFAGGGTVQAGVPIPVGERGPEMFVPNVGGNIISNSAAGSMGSGDIHIMMTNNGTPQQVKSAQPTFNGKDMVLQIITDDLRTGGPISTGVQQKFGLKKQAYM
jgi:hypothetical protein